MKSLRDKRDLCSTFNIICIIIVAAAIRASHEYASRIVAIRAPREYAPIFGNVCVT